MTNSSSYVYFDCGTASILNAAHFPQRVIIRKCPIPRPAVFLLEPYWLAQWFKSVEITNQNHANILMAENTNPAMHDARPQMYRSFWLKSRMRLESALTTTHFLPGFKPQTRCSFHTHHFAPPSPPFSFRVTIILDTVIVKKEKRRKQKEER